MKHIYILFSNTGTWLSRSISIFTKSDYAHVALSFDETFNNMYTFGRINPNNAFIAGFTIESIYKGLYTNPNVKCLIYKIPVSNKQLALLKNELNIYLMSANKYKYNLLGLFGVLLDKPLIREDYYFCSQFVATLLGKSTIWQSPKVAELTKPSDLRTIPDKKILFQGYIHEFTDYMYENSLIYSLN